METKRILMVDDDPRALFVLKEALQRLDIPLDITTAENGEEALEKLETRPVDLIITDVRMPILDGIELTEALRALSWDTRIVWITARGCREVRDVSRRLQVYGCLDKPLKIGPFRQMVLEALACVG